MAIFAQIIGIIGLFIAIISFQKKTVRGILFMQMISTAVFAFHYAMLGSYAGALLNIISAARAVVYYNKDKRWASSIAWPWSFVVIFAIATYFSGEGYLALLPFAGCCVHTYALYLDNAKKARSIIWIASPFWLCYNAISGSIGGTITELLNLTSIITAIIRLDIKKKPEKDN